MAGVLDLMGYVQQQGQLGEAKGKQNRLASLSQQAYTTAPDQRTSLLADMARTSPEAAQTQQRQFRQLDMDAASDLAREAGQFVALAEMGDPATVGAAYDKLAQRAQGVLGHPLPPTYDAKYLPGIQKLAGAAGGGELKSLRIGANGNYWAIRDGQFVDTGTAAAPTNQIVDTGNGFVGIDKRTLGATPVMQGGQPQAVPQAPQQLRAQGEVPFSIDPSLPPEVQASIRANEQQWAGAPDGANMQVSQQIPPQGAQPAMGGQQLRSTPKPQAPPAGYRLNPDGSMSMIPGGPAQVANDARADAKAARQTADELKVSAKKQAEELRQTEAATAANQLVSAIDSLTQHPGFASLGTVWGDAQINTPLIRNDAKDARAKLENIGGQVALSTMARLKALSSTGATGFGSLTAPELKLLQNSIDTLQSENISNAQLAESLKNIRDFMDRTAGWKPGGQGGAGGGAAPAGGGTVWKRVNGKLVRSN